MSTTVLWIMMVSNTSSDAGNYYGRPSASFSDRSDCEASIPFVRRRLREIYEENRRLDPRLGPPPTDFIYCTDVAFRKESVR